MPKGRAEFLAGAQSNLLDCVRHNGEAVLYHRNRRHVRFPKGPSAYPVVKGQQKTLLRTRVQQLLCS
eukprot:scaffold14424_cov105-Isochrysis_galbana.AAC.3